MRTTVRIRFLASCLLLASATALSLACPPTGPVKAPIAEGSVTIEMPREPVYVGSYHRVPLSIDRASGIQREDLAFELSDGLGSGMFSLSKDPSFIERKPTVMFGAGHLPGRHRVKVKHVPTGTVVAQQDFEITDTWTDPNEGPSLWFAGRVGTNTTFNPAFGGGPAGIQNSAVSPTSGTRRIALVLVDTSTQRYTTTEADLQAIRDRWEDEVEDGVVSGGVTRSARAFFREMSFNNLDLTADVLGPVNLSGSWTTYYTVETGGRSIPQGSFWQSAITAADSVVDYRNYDMIVFVMQEDTGTTPTRYSWAYGGSSTFTTAEGAMSLGVIVMPQFWGTVDFQNARRDPATGNTDLRRISETVSHELGHTFGLGDLYEPVVPSRNLEAWDTMAWEGGHSHFSIGHRLMLGWVQPGWVRGFDFASMGAPVDQTVTLQAIETGAPAAGRSSGIEVRIADGWNYYFEYRNGQTGQIGDQALPVANRVLGTDVVSSSFVAPISRPAILLLDADADGDGSVLGNGANYQETDRTDPVYPTDFRVDVSGIDGTKADVRIRYGVNSRPDPSIRPWPAGPDRQWQSPDIEVRNARNQADSKWFNVPWEGNPNTVAAKVKNNGTLAAPGVRVEFYVKDFTVGNAPETRIGSQTLDIAAGATVEFTTSWTPPRQGHYCIIVRIPLYTVTGSGTTVVEMTELNNVAQSNYDRFISRTASPSSREVTTVAVTNPYDEEAVVHLQPRQSNPLYRTYVEHTWVRLQPRETRSIEVMFEFAGDDFLAGRLSPPGEGSVEEVFRKLRREPNDFGLRAMVADARVDEADYMDVIGGLDAQVVEGKKSEFTRFSAAPRGGDAVVEGEVQSDGKPAPDGTVLLAFTTGTEVRNASLPLRRGRFAGDVPMADWATVRAYYLPPPGTADATSPDLGHGEVFEAEPAPTASDAPK